MERCLKAVEQHGLEVRGATDSQDGLDSIYRHKPQRVGTGKRDRVHQVVVYGLN
jgi:hypothetical protein